MSVLEIYLDASHAHLCWHILIDNIMFKPIAGAIAALAAVTNPVSAAIDYDKLEQKLNSIGVTTMVQQHALALKVLLLPTTLTQTSSVSLKLRLMCSKGSLIVSTS